MHKTIRLPEQVTTRGKPDPTQVNAALRGGAARLDWSAVRRADPDALKRLLDGLDIVEHADALGMESIPDALVEPVMAALNVGEKPPAPRGPRVEPAGRRAYGQPRAQTAPAVWSAGPEGTAESEGVGGSVPEPASSAPDGRHPVPIAALAEQAKLLTPPSPSATRDELERLVLADLLGPAGGDHEEIADRPRDRYLVGLLAPRGLRVDPEEQDELAEAGVDSAEDGPVEPSITQSTTMFPSSFGLSCSVDKEATSLVVTAAWGDYERAQRTATDADPDGQKLIWKRHPHRAVSAPILLEPGKIADWSPDPDRPDVHVRGMVRDSQHAWVVTLWLLNEQQEPKQLRDSAWLFQPELSVAAPDGAPIFRRRPYRHSSSGDLAAAQEDRAMAMRYRRYLEYAVGHGIGVHVETRPGDTSRAARITTQVVPAYEVPATTSADAADYPALGALTLDMVTLAEIPDSGFVSALTPLLMAYEDWIDRQESRIANPAEGLADPDVAQRALLACREALERVRQGIELLDASPQAADAFRFANRAMANQRIRTLIIEAKRKGEPRDRSTIDVPKNRSWRLFQLAFVLLTLPSLTDLHHPDRSTSSTAVADLLWFPTGGGKTEAYLGLTAYTLAIRRLQGMVSGRSGMDGVAVLMRYTLRLLTLQQFQRAAALICACEMIRRDAQEKGDHRWGTTPFRLGLWVGQRTTPNTTADAAEAVKRDHGSWGGGMGGHGSPAQLMACPWCGSAIAPDKHIVVDAERKRTFTYCGDPFGDCPFSMKRAPCEGLPLLVVDEEIYRNLPALLISTVDKFAQLPWKGETQMLFGQVDGYCPRHGFRSPEIEDSNSHPARNGLPAVKTQPRGPLRPPDLIIQDELHLISGPLGTLVGLYETVVDRLCSWDVDGTRVRPKVIASTATVRRASDQLHALFLRKVAVFPPQGLDAGDNFFALQRPASDAQPGRKYIGICAPGVRLKAVLIRVYVAHLAAAQVLYDKYGAHADPWMTLVGYFNAMRELGGMRHLVDDDVRARLQRTQDRGLARRKPPRLEELTSRKSSTDIPRVLQELETGFDPVREARITALRKAGQKVDEPSPIDVLLATNMLSVGVDVSRLGLMVVAGQPKSTAEYIQATSRVGRAFPGLVCTVMNWARPRDLSHYEQFEHYHATFYQHVEALSVTPFAARAIDRGLSGLLVASIRLAESAFNANDRAGSVDWTVPSVKEAVDDIAARAEEVSGSPRVASLVRAELTSRVDEWIAQAHHTTGGSTLGYRSRRDGVTIGLLSQPDAGGWKPYTCLNSLRDVEPTVGLVLDGGSLGSADTHPFVALTVAVSAADVSIPAADEERLKSDHAGQS